MACLIENGTLYKTKKKIYKRKTFNIEKEEFFEILLKSFKKKQELFQAQAIILENYFT